MTASPTPNGGKKSKAGMWFLRILKWVEECWWPSAYSLVFRRQLVSAFLLWLASVRVLWVRSPMAASQCLSPRLARLGADCSNPAQPKYFVISNKVICQNFSDIDLWSATFIFLTYLQLSQFCNRGGGEGGTARVGRTSSFMHLLLHPHSVWALKPPLGSCA